MTLFVLVFHECCTADSVRACKFTRKMISCRLLNSWLFHVYVVCIQFALPQMDDRPSRVPAADSELVADFWTVDDMFKFENVGFSNTVEHVKYLVCADCEAGPIGWQDIRHKVFYVACSRVAQQ